MVLMYGAAGHSSAGRPGLEAGGCMPALMPLLVPLSHLVQHLGEARRGEAGELGKGSRWTAAAAAVSASASASVVVVAVAAAAERGECRGDVVGDLEATGGRGHVWVIVSATHHGAHDPPWRRRKVTVTTSWRIQQPATAARGQRNPSRLRTAIHIRASGHSGGGRQGGRPGRQTGSRAGTAPREE